MLLKVLAAIFDFYSSEKLGGERETFLPRGVKKKERGGGGAMNITASVNRKTATKRNETEVKLDVVVSLSGNNSDPLDTKDCARESNPYLEVLFCIT